MEVEYSSPRTFLEKLLQQITGRLLLGVLKKQEETDWTTNYTDDISLITKTFAFSNLTKILNKKDVISKSVKQNVLKLLDKVVFL